MKAEVPASHPDRVSQDVQVRLAEPRDERAAHMLLAHDMKGFVPPLIYVAVTGTSAQVVGAAGLIPWPQGVPKGFRIALRVIQPFRRRGIGTQLIGAAIAEAKARNVQALYAPASVAVGSEEAANWTMMGFKACLTENHYEADPRKIVEMLEPLCEKMRRAGWIPGDARVVPLRDAPSKPVADLHIKFLGGTRRGIMARIRGTNKMAFDPAASQVLMLGERVVGILLGRRPEPGVSITDAAVVAPELRLGWANALLKLHTARNAARDGISKLCFTAHETHPDTRQLAALSGAKLVRTAVIPYRLL